MVVRVLQLSIILLVIFSTLTLIASAIGSTQTPYDLTIISYETDDNLVRDLIVDPLTGVTHYHDRPSSRYNWHPIFDMGYRGETTSQQTSAYLRTSHTDQEQQLTTVASTFGRVFVLWDFVETQPMVIVVPTQQDTFLYNIYTVDVSSQEKTFVGDIYFDSNLMYVQPIDNQTLLMFAPDRIYRVNLISGEIEQQITLPTSNEQAIPYWLYDMPYSLENQAILTTQKWSDFDYAYGIYHLPTDTYQPLYQTVTNYSDHLIWSQDGSAILSMSPEIPPDGYASVTIYDGITGEQRLSKRIAVPDANSLLDIRWFPNCCAGLRR